MTVPSPTGATSYAGTGTTASFAFTWNVSQAADLVVLEWVPATGVITPLALNTDYTVSGFGIQTGGTVTLTAGNLPTGTSIFIASDPALVQLLLLQQGAPFNPADLMNALDYLCREVQAARRVANNGIQIPIVESLAGLITTLPAASQRAGKLAGFDAVGNVIATSPTVAISALVPVSNVAALRLVSTPASNGLIYATGGYFSTGDGGAGIYAWNATDTRADNGGTVIQITGVATGRFNLIISSVVNPKQFGAKGDGVTNDYAAFVAAEAWAFANGSSIWIPDATYAVTCASAGLGFRVSVFTTAAIIKLTGSYVSDAYTITNFVGSSYGSNIIFQGLTINANNLARGMYLVNATEMQVLNCNFTNCLTGGVGVYTGTGVRVVGCQINGVAYHTNGVGGLAADGIFFGDSQYCVADSNTIQNFQRIGIVSDTVSAECYNNRAVNNTIFNANNCGNSTDQYNAGIWFEHTVGGQILGNRIFDIGGNAGQSSGRVIGVTVNGGGDTAADAIIVQGNSVSVCTGMSNPLYAGFQIIGQSNNGTVIMEGNWIADCGTPVVIEAGLDEVIIRDLVCENIYWNANASGNAIVFLDNSGSTFINSLTIDRVKVKNLTDSDATNNSAHLTIYNQSGWNTAIRISNVDGWNISNASAATLGRMFISDSSLALGNAGGSGMLRASELYCSNVKFGVYNNRSMTGWIYANFTAMKAVFSNCIFDGNAGSIWSIVASLSLDMTFTGCGFYNGFGILAGFISGTTNIRFANCLISQFNTSQGFFNSASQTSTSYRVMFRSNDFINSSNVAAVQNGGSQPTKSIFAYNSYSGAMSAIHNYSGPTQDVGSVNA